MDPAALKDFLTCAATFLTILKNAKDMIPKGTQRDDAERALAEAERALRISEANAAVALHYQICRCTWPPQIATSIGARDGVESFLCPSCKKTLPEEVPPMNIKPMTSF